MSTKYGPPKILDIGKTRILYEYWITSRPGNLNRPIRIHWTFGYSVRFLRQELQQDY